MTLAWKTLRGWHLIAAAIALGVGTVILRDLSVLIPIISDGSPFGSIPVAAITPLLLVVAIGVSQAQATPPTTTVSVQPVTLILLSALTLTALTFSAANYLAAAAIQQPPQLAAHRNLLAYIALFLLAKLLTNANIAPFIPVAYVFVSTVFGRAPHGGAMPWAWPTQPASPADTIVAGGATIITLGIVLISSRGRAPR